MKKSREGSSRIGVRSSLGWNVDIEAEEQCPTNGAAAGTLSGAGTDEERIWGPGVCGVPVSALDEVTQFTESGKSDKRGAGWIHRSVVVMLMTSHRQRVAFPIHK